MSAATIEAVTVDPLADLGTPGKPWVHLVQPSPVIPHSVYRQRIVLTEQAVLDSSTGTSGVVRPPTPEEAYPLGSIVYADYSTHTAEDGAWWFDSYLNPGHLNHPLYSLLRGAQVGSSGPDRSRRPDTDGLFLVWEEEPDVMEPYLREHSVAHGWAAGGVNPDGSGHPVTASPMLWVRARHPEPVDTDLLHREIAEMERFWEQWSDAMNEVARERGWCQEYEASVLPLGFPGRENISRNWDVEVAATVTVRVDSPSSSVDRALSNDLGFTVETTEVIFSATITVNVTVESENEDAAADLVDTESIRESLSGMDLYVESVDDWSVNGVRPSDD